MSDWRRITNLLGLVPTSFEAHAFDYLEHHGLKFCVHFGMANGVQLATDHWLRSIGTAPPFTAHRRR